MTWHLSATQKILRFYQHPSQSRRYLKTLLHIFKKYTSIKTFPACNLLSPPLHSMNLNVAVAKNEKENRRSVSRHSGSELRMRDNNEQLWFTVWWEEHRSLRLTWEQKKKQGRTQKQTARTSIRQDLPAFRHPPAPRDLPYHPTQREEEVKVGREREKRKKKKKQDIDVKHAVHKHTDEMKRHI